jgi:hypothetical protein
MRLPLFVIISAACSLLVAFCTCTNPNQPALIGNTADAIMPKDVKPSKVVLNDVNCWTEGDMFYAAGIVDSEEFFWKRFWLELEVLDANQNLLKVKSDSFSIVPAHSYATPPRGRTSFFWSWKLSDIGGAPDSIRLHGAQGFELFPGAILLVSNQHGVKMLSSTVKDSMNELAWMITGTLENPLQQSADRPCVDILLYGKDDRLYFAQTLDLNQDTTIIKSSVWGPMMPAENRAFGMNISYEALPAPLKAQKIGRVDILAFEKR